MIYRFLLLSDEVDDFKREITIDSESTFFDFHNAILDSVKYSKDQIASFFICEDDWSKSTEITLIEMDTSSEEDNYVMDKTRLDELLEDEGHKLLYVFEYLTERAFFIELREIIPGKNQKNATCTKSVGEPPIQISSFEDFDSSAQTSEFEGEEFYGNDDYNIDELDPDGFEGLDNGNNNPYDDPYS